MFNQRHYTCYTCCSISGFNRLLPRYVASTVLVLLCGGGRWQGCFTSTEASWPIRDGDRVGRGRENERLDRGNRPKKTGETVDRRQNNGSVKAVSPRHCPAESLRQCPLHRCWRTTWTTRSNRRPTCSAQLHLPTHDLFWANVRVQLHLPPLRPLDLLISPGTLWALTMWDLLGWFR